MLCGNASLTWWFQESAVEFRTNNDGVIVRILTLHWYTEHFVASLISSAVAWWITSLETAKVSLNLSCQGQFFFQNHQYSPVPAFAHSISNSLLVMLCTFLAVMQIRSYGHKNVKKF